VGEESVIKLLQDGALLQCGITVATL